MKPFRWAFEFAFGCHHQLSGVFTIQKRTYRVCLECGQEVEYSWALMQSLPPNVVTAEQHSTRGVPVI